MVNSVNIQIANQLDFDNIKTTMLTALEDDADAFTSTRFEFQYTSADWWEKYLSKYFTGGFNTLFLAKDGEKIVGMIAIVQNSGSKVRHVSNIYWMWVSTNFRGNGLGKKLLASALEKITQYPEIKKVNLSVISSQKTAIELYKKNGFKICGTMKDEVRFEDGFRDFINMEKFFDDNV